MENLLAIEKNELLVKRTIQINLKCLCWIKVLRWKEYICLILLCIKCKLTYNHRKQIIQLLFEAGYKNQKELGKLGGRVYNRVETNLGVFMTDTFTILIMVMSL
jgi:hypothetical protein